MPTDTNTNDTAVQSIDEMMAQLDAELGYVPEKEVADASDDASDAGAEQSTGGNASKKGKKGDHYIPKERFDSEVQRQRQQINELRAQLKQLTDNSHATTTDPLTELGEKRIAAEEALDDAMAEGDRASIKVARGALRDIEAAEREIFTRRATSQSVNESREASTYQQYSSEVERNHPELDSNSDKYDPELTEAVIAMMVGYTNAGKSKTEALRAAVQRLAPAANNRTPSLRDTRATDQRERAIDASRRQSPASPSIGDSPTGNSRIDVSRLSDAEFNKLSDRHLSVLRGDYL